MSFLRGMVLFAAACATGWFGSLGCDSIDAAFDCQSVCTRWRDCYNNDYDVGKCRDRCRSGADSSDVKRAKADACEACIDGMSCTSATFNCASDCAAIVAQ